MVLYPAAQQKAQQEIDTVVGRDRLPTFADRASLPFGPYSQKHMKAFTYNHQYS